MMWRAHAHDMLISHVHTASSLIRLIACNSSPKLSPLGCSDGGLRTISLLKILVHFEIVCMHFD